MDALNKIICSNLTSNRFVVVFTLIADIKLVYYSLSSKQKLTTDSHRLRRAVDVQIFLLSLVVILFQPFPLDR